MSAVRGIVEAVSTKYGKYSILVNDNWYGTKMEYADVQPHKGDEVEFDDGGRKFTQRMKILNKGRAEAEGSTGGYKAKSGGYSNLGVELGHASNVAKDMANNFFKPADVGSDEWYKYWVAHTDKVYNVMKAIRDKYENGAPPAKSDLQTEDVVVLRNDAPVTEDDLFPC